MRNSMSDLITKVEEFTAWTNELQGGMILYRGLADADWEVESSGHRRIRISEDLESESLLAITFQSYIDRLLDEASLQGFRVRQGKSLSDLEMLAEMQHYGAATCLIDFTTNPLNALYFACREETDKAGKVVAMSTDDVDILSTISYEDLNFPVKRFLKQGKLWKWEPSVLNTRIVDRHSVFVFGEGKVAESYLEKIQIAAAHKKDIIEALEKSFGISEQKLFNDLAGFASINSHDKKYNRFSAEDFYQLHITLLQRGEFIQAIERIDKAIELDPHNAVFYHNRGMTKGTLGDNQGAISDLDKAIELDPQYTAALNNRGNVKYFLGCLTEAIADYNRAIQIDPQEAGAYINRGNAKKASDDVRGAIADCNRAIELDPQSFLAYNNLGIARDALGDPQGAVAEYDKAIELNPQYADAYNNRGNAKKASGDLLGAMADYNVAIILNPEYATAFNNRGNAKKDLDDFQGAIADLDEAIGLDPNYADAYYNRGTAKGESDDYEGAVADFDVAIELNPDNAKAFNNRGAARHKSGDHPDAIADYNIAIKLDPNHAKAYYGRGLARRALGGKEDAEKDFAKASEIEPGLHPPEP